MSRSFLVHFDHVMVKVISFLFLIEKIHLDIYNAIPWIDCSFVVTLRNWDVVVQAHFLTLAIAEIEIASEAPSNKCVRVTLDFISFFLPYKQLLLWSYTSKRCKTANRPDPAGLLLPHKQIHQTYRMIHNPIHISPPLLATFLLLLRKAYRHPLCLMMTLNRVFIL